MNFNPDLSKQAQEVFFSCKPKKLTHSLLVFKNNFSQTFSQKHLNVMLDYKLTFENNLNNLLAKVSKAIGLYPNFEIYYQQQRKLQSFQSTPSGLW